MLSLCSAREVNLGDSAQAVWLEWLIVAFLRLAGQSLDSRTRAV